jgi:hypothetical protein
MTTSAHSALYVKVPKFRGYAQETPKCGVTNINRGSQIVDLAQNCPINSTGIKHLLPGSHGNPRSPGERFVSPSSVSMSHSLPALDFTGTTQAISFECSDDFGHPLYPSFL